MPDALEAAGPRPAAGRGGRPVGQQPWRQSTTAVSSTMLPTTAAAGQQMPLPGARASVEKPAAARTDTGRDVATSL